MNDAPRDSVKVDPRWLTEAMREQATSDEATPEQRAVHERVGSGAYSWHDVVTGKASGPEIDALSRPANLQQVFRTVGQAAVAGKPWDEIRDDIAKTLGVPQRVRDKVDRERQAKKPPRSEYHRYGN